MTRYRHCLLLLLLALCACSESIDVPGKPALDATAIAANNEAVGLMGQFEYARAQELLSGLAAQWPDWREVRVNLAIATLNRQQEGDETLALSIAEAVIAEDAGNVRAHYVAGLMQLYLGNLAQALSYFETVTVADPTDAFAAYYRGQCLAQQAELEQALSWYQRAMQLDPYLRSAYYGAFQTLQRVGREEEAAALAADYQRLENNPRSHLAEFKYTRMGLKAELLAVDAPVETTLAQPVGPLFVEPQGLVFKTPEPWPAATGGLGLSLTTVDLQGDGHADLFLAGGGPGEGNLVFEGRPAGGFELRDDHPLAAVSNVNAVLWGDYDNDGWVDAYLCRRGPNQLWRQTGADSWENITAATGTAGADLDTLDGAFFDADHDGDLDLFLVNGDGPDELFNNNLDGTFRPLGAEYGIAGSAAGSRMILPVDLDNDRDSDLVILSMETPHRVYLNDRLWSYREATGFEQFNQRAAHAVLAVDLDADGATELYTATPAGELLRWSADAQGEMQARQLGTHELLQESQLQLASFDVDGDGRQEIILSAATGWAVVAIADDRAQSLYTVTASADAPQSAQLPFIGASLSGPGMLVYSASAGELIHWKPGPGRYPFVTMTLSGAQDDAQSMRSNASGVGARLSVRTGSRWSQLQSYRNISGPGQSLQPLAVGLRGAGRADFVAIDWSDGVFQSELQLETGQLQLITETQRQLSSCPVLFAWNGEEYVFVSDVLGVGGIGGFASPGVSPDPRPWENFLLPPGLVRPAGDSYGFKITEPMEEIAYLDAARLAIYDLPPGWELVLDERMGVSGPQPTGKPHFYRREILPVAARNDRGEDVLAEVLTVDGAAAPVGELDSRFIGRLRNEHLLTIEFLQPVVSGPGDAVLVIDGWVEYPYAQTRFAAWQASADYTTPSLEAFSGGLWQSVLPEFGYPAGMPRRLSVPLAGLPADTRKLRLRTNMQIYWDRLAVVYAETPPDFRKQLLNPAAATLASSGFARRRTFAQFRPHYDYASLNPFWDTRYLAGYYTRLGPVEELVNSQDDAVAIIGPGEEVHLEFPLAEPSAPGWSRRFVLETNGWAKDMDLYTRDGGTVGPMPSTGKPVKQRDLLHARYNTRYLSGY